MLAWMCFAAGDFEVFDFTTAAPTNYSSFEVSSARGYKLTFNDTKPGLLLADK